MKVRLTLVAFAAQLLLSVPAVGAGWTEPLTITRAFVEDSDNVVIYTSGGGQSTPGCAVNAWIFVAATEERRARAWATILSAQLSGKKIQFWVTDTCAVWEHHRTTAVMLLTLG